MLYLVKDAAVLDGDDVVDLVAGQIGLGVQGRDEDGVVHVRVVGLGPVVLRQRGAVEGVLEADDAVLVDVGLGVILSGWVLRVFGTLSGVWVVNGLFFFDIFHTGACIG